MEIESYDHLQAELVRLHSSGAQPAEIAENLSLSEHTVQIMTACLLAKMNCQTIAEAITHLNSSNQRAGEPKENK